MKQYMKRNKKDITNIGKIYAMGTDDIYASDGSCKQIFEYFGPNKECKNKNITIAVVVMILLLFIAMGYIMFYHTRTNRDVIEKDIVDTV